MILRQARESDFAHLETFVWQAIFPAFNQPGLNDAQRAENDAMVETARTVVVSSLDREHHAVFVAIDPRKRTLAGYIIADASPRAYAEVRQLIVKRAHWGKGVAAQLLERATDFIGRDRAVSLSVRHYNERAIAFFAKHDFLNTGETAGDHAIPRTLLLREAYEEQTPAKPESAQQEIDQDSWLDFPTEADEPVFEALPDYNLTIEDEPIFETGVNSLAVEDPDEIVPGESTLNEQQLSELEAFIARARARKGQAAEVGAKVAAKRTAQPSTVSKTIEKPTPTPASKTRHPEIVFEIDYGVEASPKETPAISSEKSKAPAENAPKVLAEKTSFQFAFEDGTDAGAGKAIAAKPKTRAVPSPATASSETSDVLEREVKPGPSHKHCPDCESRLPAVARFCYSCGYPQPEENTSATGQQAPDDDFLVLEALPDLEPIVETADVTPDVTPDDNPSTKTGVDLETEHDNTPPKEQVPPGKARTIVSLSDLKQAFRNQLQDRILAYFGERKLKKYLARLEESTSFQQVRDGSLNNLATWLNERPPSAATRNRQRDVLADLTEYFIVETAGDLSGSVLPQRLLRYQSVNWDTADIFRLVMDYLDFDSESEQVYTDFVVMPARALKNATRSFLKAARDERIFFICDQSLISAAKNGFAITDAGIYWKNVLQPAGAATFTTLKETRLEQGHIVIDGQFFDAGGRLNLKVAVLLDKLRRM